MKVYLAHPISTRGEFEDSKRVAERIRELGYEVYVASENLSINDKSNNPTPKDIYDADIGKLLESDIVVVNMTGGNADGTITELGVIAGWNEANLFYQPQIKIVAYSSNKRVLQPQHYLGIPSASLNHLSLGAIEKWGMFTGGEEQMLEKLKEEEKCQTKSLT